MRQTAEIWPKNQILTFKKVPRGLVGSEVRAPPYSRVLCLSHGGLQKTQVRKFRARNQGSLQVN